LLAQHAADRAAALLARLHGLATAQERSGSVIEISALHAVALWAAGEGDAALTALADAVSLAQLEGYVRVFADEGPAMAALLRKLAAVARRERLPASTRIPIAYLDELLAAFEVPGDPATAGSRAVVAGLFEQLTERELEVLRLLAAGRRNDQIARELT